MALYAYFKSELGGLFTDNGEDGFENQAGDMVSESFLINQAALKLRAFKLLASNYEFTEDDIFALQPIGKTYRWINDTAIKSLPEEFVLNETYFEEVEYLEEYLL